MSVISKIIFLKNKKRNALSLEHFRAMINDFIDSGEEIFKRPKSCMFTVFITFPSPTDVELPLNELNNLFAVFTGRIPSVGGKF